MKHYYRSKIVCLALLITGIVTFLGCAHNQKRTNKDILGYGIRLAKQGYWHEAAYQWRKVLDDDPENAAALNNLAVAAEVEGFPENSRAALYKALMVRPDSKEIMRNYKSIEKRLNDSSDDDEGADDEDKNSN